MTPLNALAMVAQAQSWNALVNKKAIAVSFERTFVKYIHPTKGWRRVSNRRLGIRDAA
jgi:hypothetical protein